jgi:hypothetical protein
MTNAWVTLVGPDGRELASPTEQQLAAVLAELYAKPSRNPASAEPFSAALRFGYDDGLMYVAEISSDGHARFEEWSDRDCELALASPRSMAASRADASRLWSLMAARQVSKIRALDWQSGD